jgi:Arc/MetJ-type ribon-helix-helix transcriptional regulator
MSKATQLNMPLPAPIARGIRYLIEAGEFASQAEYIRFLVRADLPRRLAAIEQDKLVYERLEAVQKGGPYLSHQDVEAYAKSRLRGETPEAPKTIQL